MVKKSNLLEQGYTEKEIEDMTVFGGFNLTKTLLNQIENSMNFVNDIMDLEFPKTVPYVKVISKQTYETQIKQSKISSQQVQHDHLERIGEHAKYEILSGDHFIYKNNVDKIINILNENIEPSI